MKKTFFAWLIFQLISIYAWSQELSFTVQPSQIKVGVDDYFQVTYNLSNASDIKDFIPPRFDNFKLQGNPAQSSSNSVNIINGKKTVNNTVSLTFTFKPNKVGNFQIGAASVILDGTKFSTNAIPVQVVKESQVQQYDPWNSDPFEDFFRKRNVTKSRSPRKDNRYEPFTEKNLNKNVFIQLQVDKKSAYVGEQINVSYKLYTRLPMNMSLAKLPMLNGFWSQDLEAVQSQNLPKEEYINGLPFQVYTLKRSALFPQQSGNLVLDAAKAEGSVKVLALPTENIQESTDPFEAFFGPNPFGGDYGDYIFKDVRASIVSPNVNITVKELPKLDSQMLFSGAVGKFNIESSISSKDISTDESIIYKVTIFGSGNIKLIGRPNFPFNANLNIVDGIESDTILSKNPAIQGTKTFEYVINPDKSGKYTIPAFDYYYFDLASLSYKKLTTTAHEFNVTKGNSSINNESNNIAFHSYLDGKHAKKSNNSLLWPIMLVIILLLINVIIYLFNKKSLGNKLASIQEKQLISKTAIKRLQAAKSKIGDNSSAFYEEISKAIWMYVSERLHIPLANLNKESAAETLGKLNLDQMDLDKYNKIIDQCEIALYAKDNNMEARSVILSDAGEFITVLEQKLKKNNRNKNMFFLAIFLFFNFFLVSNIQAQQSIQQEFQDIKAKNGNNAILNYNKGVEVIEQNGDKVLALALFELSVKNNPKLNEAKDNIHYLNDALDVQSYDEINSNLFEVIINLFSVSSWFYIAIISLLLYTILHFLHYKKVYILFYKRIQIALIIIFLVFLIGSITSHINLNGIQYGIVIDTTKEDKNSEGQVGNFAQRGEKVRIIKHEANASHVVNGKLQKIVIPSNNLLIID